MEKLIYSMQNCNPLEWKTYILKETAIKTQATSCKTPKEISVILLYFYSKHEITGAAHKTKIVFTSHMYVYI